MTIVVRPATIRDYPEMCTIIQGVDELHRQHLPNIFQKPAGPCRQRDYIQSLLADETTGLFVAQAQAEIVGFVHVLVRDAPAIPILVPRRYALVDSLVVQSAFRRQGIGRALMDQAERWAQEQGAQDIELNVYEFNQEAIDFYRQMEYETISRKMSKAL